MLSSFLSTSVLCNPLIIVIHISVITRDLYFLNSAPYIA
jgi:hypothetical protein